MNDLNKTNKNKQLNEEKQPYIDKNGDLVLPLSWKDDNDDIDEETYKRMFNEEF